MPTTQANTSEELNKAVCELMKLIQKLCQEERSDEIAMVVQPAADLVKASYQFID